MSPTEVIANVVRFFSSDNETEDWRFGDWSDLAGWPSAVALHDGRLCFAGRDRFWASVSDAYGSFADTLADGTTVGDASSISRSIGYGPVAVLNWLLPLTRLIAGGEGSEISIRSSALDAPLTPSGGLTIKDCSTQGSARIAAVKCDKRGLFVQKSGQRLYQLAYDVNSQDYEAADMNRLHPDLNLNNPIIRIAVQRQPNTRIHCVRADGTVAVLTFEPGDEVEAWWRVDTDGLIEDVVVLPDAVEDRVYYTVRRVIGGQQRRFRERFARLDEARGGPVNRQADAHVVYRGAPTTTIGGLAHLEGRSVVVWGDGQDLGTLTVRNAAVTLPEPVSAACVGLPYAARFKSAKLAYAAQGGTALNQIKRVVKVGLILADVHADGLQFGQDYDVMDDLPRVEGGGEIDEDAVREAYDEPMIEVPGDWDTDARLCLTAAAPRPVHRHGLQRHGRDERVSVQISATTLADCERFFGKAPDWRIRAMTAHVDGEPVAIGGLAYLPDNTVIAFLEGYDAVKRFPLSIHKAVRRGLEDARRRGVRRIVSIADESVEAAPRWLERFGFRVLDQANLYLLEF